MRMVLSAALLLLTPRGAAQETERLYLSGRGSDDAVAWDFHCTGGRKSGFWTTIPVPSNWELHGFGSYNYGHDPEKAAEQGRYRRRFEAPLAWKGKQVRLVFDGAMTDTEAWLNGASVGEKHQGGFYRFEYDVTRLLKLGAVNQLEALVSKHSSDESVNAAERQADYWIFGGIYRPVFLQVQPAEHIERVAIDARADGSLGVDVFLGGVTSSADAVVARVRDDTGQPVGEPFRERLRAGEPRVALRTRLSGVRTWTAEAPSLYRLSVALESRGKLLHRVAQRFGFRSVEVRAGDGIYVNGRKVRLKGVNRHSSWPDSGRATNAALSRADVRLIKDMNMNAVRTSHYPPDEHFLDACDELGLYVLDELAGWQAPPYDTPIGERLVREMVIRDVNHPSVILWNNGNEGGSNPALDDDFGRYDPQRRAVLHPYKTAGGLATSHYPGYSDLERILRGKDAYLPTELLHGLYDGGGGAGLDDYWSLMLRSPLSAGGLLWAFADEAVKRTDRGGVLDADGNNAPDGILGPYREKEASFATIREIWAPLVISISALPEAFDGTLPLENRHDFTDASAFRFEWSLVDFAGPADAQAGQVVRQQGTARVPAIAPGTSGLLELSLPAAFRTHDALSLRASDAAGRTVNSWTWPLKTPREVARRIVSTREGTVTAVETQARIALEAAGIEVAFERASGKLTAVRSRGRPISFGNGPILVGKNVSASLRTISRRAQGGSQVVEMTYSGNLRSTRWTMYGSGWLKLEYRYWLPDRDDHADHDFLGITFSYPEAKLRGVRWLGKGPERVWKNRLRGPQLGVWSKDRNDAQTGVSWDYPEFKGYHADFFWAVLKNQEQDFVVATESDSLYLRLFTPRFPAAAGFATAPFPAGDISFLHGIPAIGNKFQPASSLGPSGARNRAGGDYSGTLYFFFGAYT